MPDHDPWFDETYDDEYDNDEYDNSEYDDDLTETVACPHCGAEVYEDAVRCPICETYITHDTNIWAGRPVWWILLGLLGIVAVIVILAGFARFAAW